MSEHEPVDFGKLYAQFEAPITALNCGDKCAPYNERGVPFCCDPQHAVPTVYEAEWEFLQQNTDLWSLWEDDDLALVEALQNETPEGQVLVGCQGAAACQRGFRSITCRSFPFFPYISLDGEFLGMSYYWEYEDRCWVISNLQLVSPAYRQAFIATYEALFEQMPSEKVNFRYHSIMMRRIFGRRKRTIPLLHRNGGAYKVSPKTGRMRRVEAGGLPKFGPYKIADELRFSDELE